MSVSLRHALAAGAFAVLSAAPAALHAQAPAADSLAFPREFVKWVLSAKGDSAWAHAGQPSSSASKVRTTPPCAR